MKDTSVTKDTSGFSPHGPKGKSISRPGVHIAMRLWKNETPNNKKPNSKNPYETVGYVLKGKAELHLEGQTLILNPGDSWSVQQNASHTYRIIETFSAIEATSPPAHAHEVK